MKELQDQLNLLNQQVCNIHQMMKAKLSLFRVSDNEYINGDIRVTCAFGNELHEWSVTNHSNNVRVEGSDSPASLEMCLWEMLHTAWDGNTEDEKYEGDWANEGYDMN